MARPRQIDRAAVLHASLQIADENGLGELTMQGVADRLGVTPMALYRHVENKQDLLDGVVEGLLDELPEPRGDAPWDQRLTLMGRAVRATARRHPTVFPLLLQLPASTPAARSVRDRVVDAFRDAGIADRDAERLERLVSTMVLAFAASESGGRFRSHSRQVLNADYAALEQLIRTAVAFYLPPGRPPARKTPTEQLEGASRRQERA